MINIRHHYSLCPVWQQQIADALGAKLINDKLLLLPKDIGNGGSVFLEVMTGLSLLFMDLTFSVPISMTRMAANDQFYIVYYDLSEEISSHIVNGTDHKIGYQSKLGMGFMDCSTESTLIPALHQRYCSLRLFISKHLLKSLMGNAKPQAVVEDLFDGSKNTLFFYGHIDSNTRILLQPLKAYSFDNSSFELLLKGIALKALNYLVKRVRNFEPIIQKLSTVDTSGILKTAEYLMGNLILDFPGLSVLAEMAGMSESKYKLLFKKVMKGTPNNFFLQEKLLLAQNLLQSGNFNSVREVAIEVGYSKPGYFSEAYKKAFNALPQEIFIKAGI